MKTFDQKRQVQGIFLLLLMLVSFALRTGHELFSHAHDHERQVCEISFGSQNDGEAPTPHLHDERYAANDCSVCAFVVAIPALPDWLVFQIARPVFSETLSFFYKNASVSVARNLTLLRGPPVFFDISETFNVS